MILYTWDLSSTRSLNQLNQLPSWSRFFGVVSRLGDGVFWYVLAAIIALADGLAGIWASFIMLTAGLCCTLIYKSIKHLTARPRPCSICSEVLVTTAPLDTFSFPSGHTLHAVCFTLVATAYVGWLALLLWPFTVLVALSRLVLGLHYPSDVLVGACIGAAVASLAIPLL